MDSSQLANLSSLIPTRPAPNSRQTFVGTPIAKFPFQLLPRLIYTEHELERALDWQWEFSLSLNRKPHFIIGIWLENCSEEDLLDSLAAIHCQSYPQFELVVALGKRSIELPRLHQILDDYPFAHTVVDLSGQSSGLGEFFATVHGKCVDDLSYAVFYEAQSLLHPSALYITAKQILKKTPDFLYANEARVDATRSFSTAFIRRSPADRYSILSMNPFGELLIFSGKGLIALIRSLSALHNQTLFEPWALGALMASIEPMELKRAFIPLALLLRPEPESALIHRVEDRSTQLSKALATYAERTQISIRDFEPFVQRGSIYFRPKPRAATGSIQVIIPYRDQSALTIKCLQKLSEQDCATDFHVTLVDNESSTDQRIQVQTFLANSSFAKISHISAPGYFNFARLNNTAAASGDSEFILFLNNDVELTSPTSVSELRKWCALSDVGVVGGELKYESGKLQHGGINFCSIRPANVGTDQLFPFIARETNGVTFAMALVKRSCFNAVGGLDDFTCPNGFGDALFCQQSHAKGFKVIYTPYATGTHYESISRGRTSEEMELLEMVQSGIPIADLYPDFYAEHQPMIVEFSALELSPFTRIVDRIQRSPKALRYLEPVCRLLLKILGKNR